MSDVPEIVVPDHAISRTLVRAAPTGQGRDAAREWLVAAIIKRWKRRREFNESEEPRVGIFLDGNGVAILRPAQEGGYVVLTVLTQGQFTVSLKQGRFLGLKKAIQGDEKSLNADPS